MKKVIISLILIVFSTTFLSAQNDTLKPVDGDWGFSLNITGLINNIVVENNQDPVGNYMIFARHYLKTDKALRMGLSITYVNQNFFSADSISIPSGNRALQELDSTISQFNYTLSLGIEKHLGTTRRLDPYVGGEILVGKIGNVKTDAKLDVTDVTGTYKEQIILQEDGGSVFGMGAIAGFNFFFSKNISLGAEFGYAFTYSKSGGDYSASHVITPVSGSQISTFENGKLGSSQKSIGATSTGGIMLSFFF